jgi:hypothetical protein
MDGELRTKFRKHLPTVLWSSIESGLTDPGVPDLHGSHPDAEFWIETKRTDCNTVSVRATQAVWHKLRSSRGVRTFFAVRKSKRKPKRIDEIFVVEGRYAEQLRAGGLKSIPVAFWADGGPSRWDWHAILRLLIGERHHGQRQRNQQDVHPV